MNSQLIEKLIKSSTESCPHLAYENPILDRRVARALSKSFIKLLKIINENNTSLRYSVLHNIKKVCQVTPVGHVKPNDDTIELLIETHRKNINKRLSKKGDDTDQLLDNFLVRKLLDIDKGSTKSSKLNPEVVQAMVNLSANGSLKEILSKELIHLEISDKKSRTVVKHLWDSNTFLDNSETSLNDICLKMKEDIEIILLEICYKLLVNKDNIEVEELMTTDPNLLHLVQYSAKSPVCFQICCNILNHLFITLNFDENLLEFISTFISYIKLHCLRVGFSTLYPNTVSNIVLLLDIDINEFPDATKQCYLDMTISHLKNLHDTSEADLILVLSHFPDWFDIYFK